MFALIGLLLGSFLLFGANAVVTTWWVERLPSDYLLDLPSLRPKSRWKWLRNVLGLGLLFVGIALLVLPGPGLLTIAAALTLVDLPGKRKWERKLLGHPRILSQVNALRRQRGKPPLSPPSSP
jgi:hypothetical protein